MLVTGHLDTTAVFPTSKKTSQVFLHWTFDPQICDHCAVLELWATINWWCNTTSHKNRELRKALITH